MIEGLFEHKCECACVCKTTCSHRLHWDIDHSILQ